MPSATPVKWILVEVEISADRIRVEAGDRRNISRLVKRRADVLFRLGRRQALDAISATLAFGDCRFPEYKSLYKCELMAILILVFQCLGRRGSWLRISPPRPFVFTTADLAVPKVDYIPHDLQLRLIPMTTEGHITIWPPESRFAFGRRNASPVPMVFCKLSMLFRMLSNGIRFYASILLGRFLVHRTMASWRTS